MTATNDGIINLKGRIQNGKLVALLDHDGKEIGAPVTAKANMVTGGIELSVGAGIVASYGVCNSGYEPVTHPLTPAAVLSSTQQGGGSVSVVQVDTVDGPALRVTGSTAGSYIEVAWALTAPVRVIDAAVNCQVLGNQSTLGIYFADSAGYANFLSYGQNIASGLNNSARGSVLSPVIFMGGSAALAPSGTINASTLMSHAKLRITPQAGNVADIVIGRLSVNHGRKGRISIMMDDGYDSWFYRAIPELNKRQLICSMGIIPSLVGTAGYMSLAQWKSAVASGHECVPHGPVGGAGSLIDNYATNAERVADVSGTQAYITSNALGGVRQNACYVFPQGKFQTAVGDSTLLDDLIAQCGVKLARGVQRFLPFAVGSARKSKYGPLLLPIIGHQRGTTSANEDTEVASIVAAIQSCADNGTDGILMFHKVIADQGAYAYSTAIEIEISRLVTILDAVVTQRSANKVEVIPLSALVPD